MSKKIVVKFIKHPMCYYPAELSMSALSGLCFGGLISLGLLESSYPEEMILTATNKDPKDKGYKKLTFEPRLRSVSSGTTAGDPRWFYVWENKDRQGEAITSPELVNLIESLRDHSNNADDITLWIKIDTERY